MFELSVRKAQTQKDLSEADLRSLCFVVETRFQLLEETSGAHQNCGLTKGQILKGKCRYRKQDYTMIFKRY